MSYETQNKLYDNIASHTHQQLVEIDDALNGSGEFDLRMKFCLLLGTYVKRCSNLMLTADKNKLVSTDELYLSISESFENMGFLGVDCEVIRAASKMLPPALLIAAYDLFEAVIETVLDTVCAFSVRIMPSENVLMTIETDSLSPDVERLRVSLPQLRLSSFVEDDIRHLTLSIGGDGNE
ncbi:MAG: hypothetical protein IJ561_03655 [Ruminococcus sp.]|nr:hypothetical protein [Ruminococcus sp.]